MNNYVLEADEEEYYVFFSGSICVRASSPEEATDRFIDFFGTSAERNFMCDCDMSVDNVERV